MLRLRFDALDSSENEFCYEGKLFTGIAFETSEGRVLDAVYIQNGVRQRPYFGDYVKVMPGDMRLEADCEGLEGEREYNQVITLNKIPFSGVLYEFEDVFCTGEAAFEKGIEKPVSVDWFRNGTLRCYDNFSNGVGEAFDWFDDGHWHRICSVRQSGDKLSAEFDEKGCLRVLDITRNFFASHYDPPTHSFSAINKLSDLARFNVSSFLLLAGRGISVDVFQVLFASGLEHLEVFKSFDTLLGHAEFAKVAELPNIHTIDIDEETGSSDVLANLLREIKKKRVDMDIQYNDKIF